MEDVEHRFVIGYRPEDGNGEGDWIGWVERATGPLGFLFGGHKKGVQPEAVRAIHEVLSGSPQIREVRWHSRKDFDGGREELGSPTP